MSTQRALRHIAALPPDQAELVVLRVVVGLDVGDVATVTGRSPGSVRVAVHRALRRLRSLLEEEQDAPERLRVTGGGATPFSPRDERRTAPDW
jgi:RNA polymerase sigma-70 factor (ECF subfamily)